MKVEFTTNKRYWKKENWSWEITVYIEYKDKEYTKKKVYDGYKIIIDDGANFITDFKISRVVYIIKRGFTSVYKKKLSRPYNQKEIKLAIEGIRNRTKIREKNRRKMSLEIL